MQFSHSRVDSFKQCPYKYKLRYVNKIKTIPADNADNALYLGTAMHEGIEKGTEAGIKAYYDCFNIIDDNHINEVIKLEYLIPKVREILPDGEYERAVSSEHFVSFLDLLTPNEDGTYDLYDFKYSNNIKNYMESGQLHEYKFFFESTTGKKIRKMYFVFVPKVQIKQKKTEDLREFRQRIQEELDKSEVTIKEIEFDYTKVIEFYEGIKTILEADSFPKNPNYLCNWCDYQDYCEKGRDYMLLPSSERRNVNQPNKRKIWLYGAAFSGKTTMLDQAPMPLNLNTDGNIEFVTMPYISIKDQVTVEGRQTKRKFAWEVFKETIAELEKNQNDFQTIIVDLLEDTREMCRIYKYDEMGIQHESDSGFGKGWDIIKTEYLSTIRRLFNLDYENIIVVSHEDISKDITKKNGQNITRISPNIQDAIANKVAGMVDIVARVLVEDDGSRTLNFKSNEVIFGGGRLKGIKETSIPLDWNELMKVYESAGTASLTQEVSTPNKSTRSGRKAKDEPTEEPTEEPKNFTEEVQETEQTEKSSSGRKSRKSKDETPVTDKEPVPVAEITEEVKKDEEASKTRTRKRRE